MARFFAGLSALCFLLCTLSFAQYDANQGILPFSTRAFGVDLATGSLNLSIPMRNKAGKVPFSFSFEGNFHSWLETLSSGTKQWASTAYLSGQTLQAFGWIATYSTCGQIDGVETELYIIDPTGARHAVAGTIPCAGATNLAVTATDGSGYSLVMSGEPANGGSVLVHDTSGNAANANIFTTWFLKDPDGNAITSTLTYQTQTEEYVEQYTDSLGQSVLTETNAPPVNSKLPTTYAYFDANGNSQQFISTPATYTFATNFGCAGMQEGGSETIWLPVSISTPTGVYSFAYEQTPGYGSGYTTGRLAKITYPSGGSISYTYSGGNNGINCASGVVPKLTVTVNDNNGNIKTWTYTNSNNSSTAGSFTVTVQDPANNCTVYSFSGEYQTQQQVYQGAVAPANLLLTQATCYNAKFTNCAAPSLIPSLPFLQTDVYTSYNGGPSNLVETKFDTYGNTIEVKQYDFGAAMPPSGNPVFDTLTYYGQSWNGTSCTAYPSSIYIFNTPCYSYTKNSSGATVAQTQITYSNTGHPTSTVKLTSGSSSLTSTATYNSNGTVATATDVNGTVATTTYSGTGGCNGLLPTSVTAGGLTTSMQWNCNGGVVTQTADTNGQPTGYAYIDPLWRPTSMTDPLGNVTNYSYATPTTVESAMNFNSSTTDELLTADGLGRLIKSQRRTAPGATTFDNAIVYGYGWNSTGAFTTQTLPGGTAVTKTQNDALGRPLTITDGGGGTVSYTNAQNDVLSVLSPAPSGENNKQTQKQFDGLGRITSSCAIGNGSTTACGQSTGSANGVTTSTTYTSAAGSQTVSSTRGAQTRSQTVDGLGRVTSTITPEGGTTTYIYDYVPPPGTCGGWTSQPGDLMVKINGDGSQVCYVHDALHRLITTGTSNLPNTCKRFLYDSVSNALQPQPSGSTLNNLSGRLMEAETDNCTVYPPTSTTMITDEWFSYDKDGHVTDMWEKTPHSGTYYHSFATFAGNGVPLTVQLVNPSLYTMTYGLDGEGRPSTLKGNSTTVVSGTTFNASSQPTYIDLGTGTDQSDYVYDPNTGRMTKWTFQVGSTSSETGALTWNTNGTLKTLAINDGFNVGGTQTCNFNPSLATGTGYDDTGRLVGIDCGSGGWGQTFSYDEYDNLTKAVISGRTGITWNPGYNPANNHYSSGASYDNSGNLTYDTIHLYTWDAYDKLSTIDSSACGTNGECVTYDAMGQAVETSYNSAYTEILYTQLGKVYMTGGTTPYYAYWPTPGNGTVEVNGNALTFYYMHKDWLGSARISSVIVNPAVVSDQAYAPYGEVYDKEATGAAVPAQMFTGDTQDIISGIFDTPNRELNASQGRWLSPDPANSGWNQYAYPANPNSDVDPSGLCSPSRPCRLDYRNPYGDQFDNSFDYGFNFYNGPDWDEFDVMAIPVNPTVNVSYVWTPAPPGTTTTQPLDLQGNPIGPSSSTLFTSGGDWTPVYSPVSSFQITNVQGVSGGGVAPGTKPPQPPNPPQKPNSPNYGAGLCAATPALQLRHYGGCSYVCEFVYSDPFDIRIGGMHATGPAIDAACGPGRFCPALVTVEKDNPGATEPVRILSCVP